MYNLSTASQKLRAVGKEESLLNGYRVSLGDNSMGEKNCLLNNYGKKMNLDLYLTSKPKINLRSISVLNIKTKIIKFLKENTRNCAS